MTKNDNQTQNEATAKQASLAKIPAKETGAKRRRIRKWVLRLSLALTILGPLIFAVAAIGHKLGLMSLSFSFGVLTRGLGPKVLIVSLIVAVVALILALIIKPKKGILIGVVGILIPVFGMGYALKVTNKAQSLPFIHDITTDTQDVPKFGAKILAERAAVKGVNTTQYAGETSFTTDASGNRKEALVSVLQTKGYPDIRSIVVSESRDEVFEKAKAVSKQMGWKIKASDAEIGTIEATDTTFWFGFEDDIIIRLRDSEGGGTLIDIRSLSRIGKSDIGKNAERIRSFLDKMNDA